MSDVWYLVLIDIVVSYYKINIYVFLLKKASYEIKS